MKTTKILISLIIIGCVAFFTARGCVSRKTVKPAAPFQIKIGGHKIKLVIEKEAPSPAVVTTPAAKSFRVAIILDDWGVNRALVRSAIDIRRPLTLSIIPKLAHSRDIAQDTYRSGLGVMLHMPMQPKKLNERLEPHTIKVDSTDKEIRAFLKEAMESVPYAEGMNNHMGSAATSDERVMRTVLKYLQQKGLYFVDSRVVATTVGGKIAKEIGVPYAMRDIFIDNDLSLEAIKKQLIKAKRMVLKKGSAIVIGHAHKTTLNALEEMVPEFEKDGIKFVLAKELVGSNVDNGVVSDKR